MSGAQGKAGVITGCIAIVAEVDIRAIKKRFEQGSICLLDETLPFSDRLGWIQAIESDLDKLVNRYKTFCSALHLILVFVRLGRKENLCRLRIMGT